MNHQIIFIQFTNPAAYPPIQNAARIFKGKGWSVAFLSMVTSSSETKRMSFDTVSQAHFYWVRGTAVRMLLPMIYVWFCLKAVFIIFFKKIDWVYGSDHWALPVLYFSKKILKKKTIYHEHDSPGNGKSFLLKWIISLREITPDIADIKIVPNRHRVEKVFSQENWLEVKNYPSAFEVPALSFKKKDILEIYYHGSINSERLPLAVIDALKTLNFKFNFKFAGYETLGSRGYIQKWLEEAHAKGLGGCVNYLGVIEKRKDLLSYASKHAHVGLSFVPLHADDINMMYMCGASNKAYDYLSAGCAVLVSDLPEWRETYVFSEYGFACDPGSSESIAAALTKFYNNFEETLDMGRRGREKVLSEWNYEKAFESVLKKIDYLQ